MNGQGVPSFLFACLVLIKETKEGAGAGAQAVASGGRAQAVRVAGVPLQAVRCRRSGAARKKPKNRAGIFGKAPPPPKNKITFVSRAASSNRYIAPTLKLSEKSFIFTLKYFAFVLKQLL
jgi:hypothetical protein